MGESDQAVVNTTARIDWRKLLLPSILIMVLPTITALVLDKWVGLFPLLTIAAILICFPAATILVTRRAMKEMNRVIQEVAPPSLQESLSVTPESPPALKLSPELESGAEVSSTS